MELNEYGRKFVEEELARIDEDRFYANIGAYDPEAIEIYKKNRRQDLTKIALEFQDTLEFCVRHGKTDI